MSIDASSARASFPDPTDIDPSLAARALTGPREAAPAEPSAADQILAPIDHFKDMLAGDLTKATSAVEAETAGVPVLAQAAQFATGALSAAWGMAEGTYTAVRHPVETVKGLWTMASHVPVVSPMWWVNGVKDGFGETLASDKAFWKAVGKGVIDPYAKDWKAGRYFAVAGRASVDVGTMLVGVKNAKAALEGWKAERVGAKAALLDEAVKTHPQVFDDGLRASIVGQEARATGQAIGEGVTTVGKKTTAKAMMKAEGSSIPVVGGKETIDAVKKAHVQKVAVYRRPIIHYKGGRKELYGRALKTLERDRDIARRLQLVGPERLEADVLVRRKFRTVTRSVDARIDGELEAILGQKPSGLPKRPERAAAKLSLMQDAYGPGFRLGDLEDLARGRIDLPSYDPKQIRALYQKIREHYGDQNLIVADYMKNKPYYRGRLHVKIRDRSGMWYELQMGPKQLSTFYDTPFKVGEKVVNIHDAVYKGLMRLDNDALKVLGQGSAKAGAHRVALVMDEYVNALDEVMATAKAGSEFHWATRTKALRKSIADLMDEVPEAHMPIGLRG
jgi:hypothetical protein